MIMLCTQLMKRKQQYRSLIVQAAHKATQVLEKQSKIGFLLVGRLAQNLKFLHYNIT